jgi:hypothetical protein
MDKASPDYEKALDEAKLRLALLKENFSYRAFFKKFKNSPELMMDQLNSYGIDSGILKSFALPNKVTISEIVQLLDPNEELQNKQSPFLIDHVLPQLFFQHAIQQIIFSGAEGMKMEYDHSLQLGRNRDIVLLPSERLLKIDLSKKREQIINEINSYLDLVLNKYTDHSRKIQKAWEQLRVWKLRKKRKPFAEIALITGTTVDTVKKRFYKAYQRTQGKEYDKNLFRKETLFKEKSDLKKTCDTCSHRNECTVLCPEILEYVDQDTKQSASEKQLSDSSESFMDFLAQKNRTP